MRQRKSAYELSRSQVDTPTDVVSLFWKIAHSYRERFSSVLDLGAGDGRFALGGRYKSYLGLEIDRDRLSSASLPSKARILHTCAFRHQPTGYSACIGNPPYVRHHDLEYSWRDRIANRMSETTGQLVNRKCNLYIYFLYLAIQKCHAKGIVAVIVPYEWVSRPAALPLRQYIKENGWRVDTYRFSEPIFTTVETTCAISVIDKSRKDGVWNFYSVTRKGKVAALPTVTGSKARPLAYADRGNLWATRGLSPGTQDVFTLTEGERIHAGLRRSDVYPCVTTLRHLPSSLTTLNASVFRTRYVEAGHKCWLVKSDAKCMSDRLRDYLNAIPESRRMTATCLNRETWFTYTLPDIPDLLVSSGFVSRSPKTIVNSVGAVPVGGVHGVHGVPTGSRRALQSYISTVNLATRIVAHSGNLRKIEIKQLNALLTEFRCP